MPAPAVERTVKAALLVALLGALGGAVWSAMAGAGCSSCASAADLLGGKLIAWSGVVFYVTVVIIASAQAQNRLLPLLLGLAGGGHAVLAALLFYRHVECLPCLFTAGSAWTAMGVAIVSQPRQWPRSLGGIIVGMILMATLVLAARQALGWSSRDLAQRMLPRVARSIPDAELRDGAFVLVVYERPGCENCDAFRREFVPALQDRYGDRMSVEYRQAERWMHTPTIFLVGDRTDVRIGVESLQDVAAMLGE